MEAKELRIGNFVGLDLKEFPDNYFTMVEVAEQSTVVTGGLEWHPIRDRQYFDCEYLEPIPLTEEWLLKFGFVKTKSLWIFTEELWLDGTFDVAITIDDNSCIVYSHDETDGSTYYLTKIKYAHQLQNLYFALTGKELEIKI